MPGNMPAGGQGGGGLADMIPGGLGGLLGGAAAGTVLSGGLENLIKGFQQSGQGRAAQSWVDNGPNEQIAPGDLESALGSRHDRRAQPADRDGARGVAHRTEPATAGLRRSAHARRAVADRGRGVAAGVRLRLSRPGPGSVHRTRRQHVGIALDPRCSGKICRQNLPAQRYRRDLIDGVVHHATMVLSHLISIRIMPFALS